MHYKRTPLELSHVLNATSISAHALKNATAIVNDVKHDERVKAQECRRCFYYSKLGGQAITSSNCSICNTELIHGNTNIDELCMDCAKKHKLCKHCCADMELKQRREL